jgi:hypothetical protein
MLAGQPEPYLNLPSCDVNADKLQDSFFDIAQRYMLDKTPNPKFTKWTTHAYQTAYQRWLGPLRDRRVRLLEIGLGCTMPVTGESIYLWREFLPCVHLVMMEYDRPCAEEYAHLVEAMFVGDQSSADDLKRLEQQHGAFDAVIDDGGHSVKEQVVSLQTLFPLLPPGGLYFLEDLLTEPQEKHFDLGPKKTTVRFLAEVASYLHQRTPVPLKTTMQGAFELAQLVLSMDCIRELCVLVRNDVPAA